MTATRHHRTRCSLRFATPTRHAWRRARFEPRCEASRSARRCWRHAGDKAAASRSPLRPPWAHVAAPSFEHELQPQVQSPRERPVRDPCVLLYPGTRTSRCGLVHRRVRPQRRLRPRCAQRLSRRRHGQPAVPCRANAGGVDAANVKPAWWLASRWWRARWDASRSSAADRRSSRPRPRGRRP
jgi:hypothetical protein